MIINFKELSPSRIYHTITQTLIARPIAWVLSEGSEGQFNLAPFSYFTAVCSNPPLLAISIGKKADGSDKDTLANIKRDKRCVIHIASTEQLDALNASSEELPEEISEIDKLGLELAVFTQDGLPRLMDCAIAYACSLYEIKEIGDLPQSLLLLQVDSVYVNDEVVQEDDKSRKTFDAKAMDPLLRLGASEYANLGEIISRKRP